MALLDVKEYYVKMLNQYIEVKNDLSDFEEALKAGYITEDKLAAVKEDVESVKNNLDRLSYILFLFDLPARKKKKVKYKKANERLLDYFASVKSDETSVIDENIDLIAHLREELKKLKK